MTKHYVSPDGATRIVDGKERQTVTFEHAVSRAEEGDEILILSGAYTVPFVLDKVSGSAEKKITIRGDSGATLDGRRELVRPPNRKEQSFEHFAFIKIRQCAHIEICNLTIQNIWPTAIYIEESQHLVFSRLNIHGSTFAFFANGKTTHDLLIERCAWVQDVRIWDQVLWKDIHHFPLPRKELDGDFFRSYRIAGRVVIRRNFIAHAFNGVQFFAEKDKDEMGEVNHDVWIYENTFQFIRDNAVEAEYMATNWWVYRNRIYNCHKWFAFEHCGGGHWYIFANVGWFDRKPGPPGDENSGGAVFKTNNIPDDMELRRLPSRPVYVFHNSWYLRSSYVKKGKLRKFNHFNNAIEYASAEVHGPDVVKPTRRMFGDAFKHSWSRLHIRFENDLCNHREFPHYYAEVRGMQIQGIHDQPLFREPHNGYFAPQIGEKKSPLIGWGKAKDIERPNGATWEVPAGLNIGAVERVHENKRDDILYRVEDFNAPPEAFPPPSLAPPETSADRDKKTGEGASECADSAE